MHSIGRTIKLFNLQHFKFCNFLTLRFVLICVSDPVMGASNARGYEESRFSTNISLYLANDARQSHSYYRRRIRNPHQLSNGTILNDLEWPLTQISRSRYYLTSNNSKTVQDRAILQWRTNRKSYVIYRTAPFSMILNKSYPSFQGHAEYLINS